MSPFNIREAAEDVVSADAYATGGAQLYVFSSGAYRPGETHIRRCALDALDSDWTKRRSDEVVAFARIAAPELWSQPPLDTINVANGLLSTSTRELREHSAEFLSPVQVAAAYDPAATCPAIDAYLESTIPELAPLFEEIAGYLLTPDNRLAKAIMFMGPGGTGKSTAANLLRALVGEYNVSAVALHQLEEDRFATADLYGRLVNVFADLPAHALKSSSMFKSITGGDRIRAERKHRDAFDFTPYARLVFSANEVPPTADNSDAFFDRWLILPFTRKHRGAAGVDHDLIRKLTTPAELSGLLNRALNGLERLHKQGGFTRVSVSDEAAEQFRIDADSAAGFVQERCELDEAARIPKPVLFQSYRAWCEQNNRRPFAAVRFGRRLVELYGLTEGPSKGRDYWHGIDLRELP